MKKEFITIMVSNGETQSFALDIKELELKNNSSIENLNAFIPIQDLEKITLINCEKLNDLSAIGAFKKLRVLSLESCNALLDLSPVNKVDSMEKLKCIEFTDLKILETLKENTKVKSIDILEDRKCFTGFSKTYPNLLSIYFKTQNLIDLKPLESLSNLKCLALYYCNSISDLNSIANYTIEVKNKNSSGLR